MEEWQTMKDNQDQAMDNSTTSKQRKTSATGKLLATLATSHTLMVLHQPGTIRVLTKTKISKWFSWWWQFLRHAFLYVSGSGTFQNCPFEPRLFKTQAQSPKLQILNTHKTPYTSKIHKNPIVSFQKSGWQIYNWQVQNIWTPNTCTQ